MPAVNILKSSVGWSFYNMYSSANNKLEKKHDFAGLNIARTILKGAVWVFRIYVDPGTVGGCEAIADNPFI